MPTIKIMQDDADTESPREWCNMGEMVTFHSRYTLGDEHGYSADDYAGWDEMGEAILRDHPGGVILPLYLYDHSGITIATTPFNCPWDSGQVGFIVASAAKIRESFGVKRITAKVRERATESLRGEVATMDQFIRGDVYRFTIEDDDGNITDSCGGFYGPDPFTNGMSEHFPVELHAMLEETVVTYG